MCGLWDVWRARQIVARHRLGALCVGAARNPNDKLPVQLADFLAHVWVSGGMLALELKTIPGQAGGVRAVGRRPQAQLDYSRSWYRYLHLHGTSR